MWSIFVTVCAIAVASNLDNAGVGIAYGARKIQISWAPNTVIAVISGIATYIAGVAGTALTHYVSVSLASLIGGIVMWLVGLWVLSEPLRTRAGHRRSSNNMVTRILRDPVEADFDKSQTISMKEALVLGVALALNALAGGFDSGVVHISVVLTAFAVALCSFCLLGFSAWIGRRYAADTLGNRATYVAGLLLVVIGIHQIW